MEFLSIGGKLKKLRKQLKMKQEELSDANISRGFISMIEIGKRTPNADDSKVIVDKLRNRAKELNIVLDIDDLYLTRNEIDEAKLYCCKSIKSADTVSEINNIIAIARDYDFSDILAAAYKRLGDAQFENKNYNEAFTSYMNTLDAYKRLGTINDDPYLYNMMGRCKINQVQYTEALVFFNLANYHAALQNNLDIRKRSVYNLAVCNKKLGNIKEALNSLDTYLSICDKKLDFTVYIYANILKSTCYETIDLFDKAIEVSEHLLLEFADTNNALAGMIYNNLGVFHLKNGSFTQSIKYFDLSQKIRESVDKNNLCHTIIEKASVYIQLDFYDEAIKLLQQGLEQCSQNNDMEYQLKAYYSFVDIYTKSNKQAELEKVYLEMITLLNNHNPDNYKTELINIYIKLSRIYLEQNDVVRIKNILSILEELSNK